jgi:phosphoglycolate phosphatase-like HAD superfamily hydrolase
MATRVTAAVSKTVDDLLCDAAVVFWDFDGVVKDSVEVKTKAFEQLFAVFGDEVVTKVRRHHEANGGVSRFKKMPQYLEWAGQVTDQPNVQAFCDRFSELVFQAVIDAPWVPGVREYLLKHFSSQRFALITATPQEEIERIVRALHIEKCFREIHGSPTAKADAIRDVLTRWQVSPAHALMIGDADTDMAAAAANGIAFALRRTALNLQLQQFYYGVSFDVVSQ